MKPLNNYLLVEVENNKMKDGLFIPSDNSNSSDILRMGKVVDISDSVHVDILKGDSIYFNKHAITKIPNEENRVLVRVEDIYLKI